jgi:Ca2+-binding RTX toxin-like protein
LGSASGDTLIGGNGATTLVSNAGGNTLEAGTGQTSAEYLGLGGLTVNLASGRASVSGSSASDTLIGITDVLVNGGSDTLIGGASASTLEGGAGNNTLIGGSGATTADFADAASGVVVNLAAGTAQNGLGGTDTLSGIHDVIGSSFADTLIGDSGTDTLDGGGGGDTLEAGSGNDTFVFGRGYGFDTIIDNVEQFSTTTSTTTTPVVSTTSSAVVTAERTSVISGKTEVTTTVMVTSFATETVTNNVVNTATTTVTTHVDGGADTLLFKPGVAVSDVMAEQSGNNLVVALRNPNNPTASFSQLTDQVTFVNWFNPMDQVQTFSFANGTSINVANMSFQTGGSGNETLVGSGANNWLVAGSGNDTLIGGTGNNILVGGAGNDTLIGGAGNNMLIGTGGVNTTAVYTSTSTAIVADLATGVAQNGQGGTDTLVGIQNIIASGNGTTLTAGGGSDVLQIVGGTGGTLAAANGADTLIDSGTQSFYRYGSGDGPATIVNGSSANSGASNELDLGPGLSDENLWFVQSGNDLQIDITGTNSGVTLKGWFSSAGNQLQGITAGGLKIDSQISQLVQAMATYSADNPGFNPAAVAQAPNDNALQSAIAASWHH